MRNICDLNKSLIKIMCEDDIQDINSISLDIKNFCDMLMSLNKNDEASRLILEIQDCANTIVQIIKETK